MALRHTIFPFVLEHLSKVELTSTRLSILGQVSPIFGTSDDVEIFFPLFQYNLVPNFMQV